MGEMVLYCDIFKCGRIHNSFKMVMGYTPQIIRIGKYNECLENPHFKEELGFPVL